MTKIITPGSGSMETITDVARIRFQWYDKGTLDVENPTQVIHKRDVAIYRQSNGWVISVRNTWDSCIAVAKK
jgi:hypothetical protein